MTLKIENLKKGDKIFCVKTFIVTKPVPSEERGIFLNGRDFSTLTQQEKSKYRTIPFNKYVEYEKFVEGKTYIIKDKLGFEITIKSEDCDYVVYEDENFLNEYFISQIEGRKIKLEKLSDDNFYNFLRKIK